jgi:hypothetical protein
MRFKNIMLQGTVLPFCTKKVNSRQLLRVIAYSVSIVVLSNTVSCELLKHLLKTRLKVLTAAGLQMPVLWDVALRFVVYFDDFHWLRLYEYSVE